jgi:hypothetical protein
MLLDAEMSRVGDVVVGDGHVQTLSDPRRVRTKPSTIARARSDTTGFW